MLYIEEVLRYHRYQESVPLEASAVAFFSELCFNILLSAYLHFTVKFDCVCGTNPLKGGAVQQCMGFRAVSCIFKYVPACCPPQGAARLWEVRQVIFFELPVCVHPHAAVLFHFVCNVMASKIKYTPCLLSGD